MVKTIAFFGTGSCDSDDIILARMLHLAVAALCITLIVFVIKKQFLKRSLLRKILAVVVSILLVLAAALAMFVIALGAACSGYSGFF